jgi:hypothetical protein
MQQRLEATREAKLRAACDRCHDLKNRCVRTGGPDSRCDRCERLDIDCVYRTNSRTGRPRAERQPPEPELQLSQGRRGKNSESFHTTKSRKVHSRQSPRRKSSDTAPSAVDSDQNDLETGNTSGNSLDGSTSDAMDLVVSPEGRSPHVHADRSLANMHVVVRQTDLDWTLDFSRHINADIANNSFSEALFQDACGDNIQAIQESEDFSLLESDSSVGRTGRNTEATTDRLLQLQSQLHRLFLTTDQETIMDQPAVDEVLEATKGFLEILQASLAAQSCLSEPIQPLASSGEAPSKSNEPSHGEQNAQRKQARMSYITLLQVLTCYSYILHALDPVVGALTSQMSESTTGAAESRNSIFSPGLESLSQPALSLGFFNLASQPAINAGVVLHIVLRMIQQLRVSIHMLTSGCREVSDRLLSPPATDMTRKLHATSILLSSQPVVEIISEREKSLVERLSCLTNSQ